MAPSTVSNDVVQGDTFLPGQILVFGSFVPRAKVLGHLEQIDGYTPGHQVRFGSFNNVADSVASDGAICSGFKVVAATGTISWM